MKKLRVGIIGLGMGRGHAKQFGSHSGTEVAAVADADAERLASRGDELGVKARYASGVQMIRKEKLDIVCVATPNRLHKPLTIAALKAGCHVLCEKPMAMNAREAADMLRAARAARRRLMINFSFRFTPVSWALKKEVERGILGDIYFARTVWLRRRGLPRGGWFSQKAQSGGGPLIDLGVHRLDLALWLMDYPEPEWVVARTYDHLGSAAAKAERKHFDVEDLAAAFITFKNGASLELEASWAGHIKERELMETRLLGTQGGLVQRNLNEGYDFEGELFLDRNGCQYDLKPHLPVQGVPSAMHHFADSILSGKPHIATGEEGLTVMKLLDAIYESARKRKPVRIGSRN